MKRFFSITGLWLGFTLQSVAWASITPLDLAHCNQSLHPAKDIKLKPSQIEWTKRVDQNCVVYDQRSTNTCHLHAGTLAMDLILRKLGLLKPEENISRDFYMSLHAREIMLLGVQRREGVIPGYNLLVMDTGGFLFYVSRLVKKWGIVTLDQYRFAPAFGEGGGLFDSRGSSLLESELAQIQDKGSVEKHLFVFEKYLGDLDAVKPRISPETIEQLGLFETESYLDISVERDPRTFASVPGSLQKVLAAIQSQIDLGIAPLDTIIRRHSIAIVGYKKNELTGEITHLLAIDSNGLSAGENGYRVFDLDDLEKGLVATQVLRADFKFPSAIE